MNPVFILVGVLLLVMASSAFASNKKKEQPKTDNQPDDPLPSTKQKPAPGDVVSDIVKIGAGAGAIVGAVKGAVAGIGGASVGSGGSAGVGTSAGASATGASAGGGTGSAATSGLSAATPGAGILAGYAIAVAAYVFLRELTLLGEKSKQFARRVGRAARPTFGQLQGLELAFIRETLNAARVQYTESSELDDRFTTNYIDVVATGYRVTINQPSGVSMEEWRAINKLARYMSLQALLFQSHIASRWSSNWTGMTGLGGRSVPTIGELGFSGPGVSSWNDVNLNASIPYDSIPTPGGMYFAWGSEVRQPGDEDMGKAAALHGIISACLILKTDPTWYLVYNPQVYAEMVFNWGDFASLGLTRTGQYLYFQDKARWASASEFTVSLSKTDAGKLSDAYSPAINVDSLFTEPITFVSLTSTKEAKQKSSVAYKNANANLNVR